MSSNNTEGPWGSPGGNKSGGSNNPWSNKGTPNGGPSRTPDMPPPDFDKLFNTFKERLKFLQSRFGGPAPFILLGLIAILVLWVLSGLYQVGAEQVGVVMRFGAFNRIETAGLRYHLPYPIEDVLRPNVTSQNEIQVGFHRYSRDGDSSASIPEESMMLTQDQNIINVEFTVFWRISDVQKFLFEIRDPTVTIKMAAESIMREVIGQNKLQYALTDGRGSIADDARARLQKLMDEYNVGVIITQVNLQTVSVPAEVTAAFQDVVNARLDQERFQNEANSHANKVVPEAKGKAAQITQAAIAYHDQKIAIAQGDAARFTEVLAAYNMSKDVTAKRLYLETMENILAGAKKVILGKSASGAVPYLPLQDALTSKSDKSEGAAR